MSGPTALTQALPAPDDREDKFRRDFPGTVHGAPRSHLQDFRVDLARIGMAEIVEFAVGTSAPAADSACAVCRATCTGNFQSSLPCTR